MIAATAGGHTRPGSRSDVALAGSSLRCRLVGDDGVGDRFCGVQQPQMQIGNHAVDVIEASRTELGHAHR